MVRISSEGRRDMLLNDMEDDREGSESDGSSIADEEDGGGRNGEVEEEDEVSSDDDDCNDDVDEDIVLGSESVNGSQSGVR